MTEPMPSTPATTHEWVDVDALPPTQYLLLDVLEGRWRVGERLWTFPSGLAQTARALDRLGLVAWKGGIVQGTIMVWLTEAGRDAVLHPDYVSPDDRAVAAREAAARAEADRLVEEISRSDRTIADLTAERDALRRQIDAAKALCDAAGTPPSYVSSEWRHAVLNGDTPPVLRVRDLRRVLAADPQRTGTPPQPVQEPRTPAPGSPSTPETLSGRLSTPDRDTA